MIIKNASVKLQPPAAFTAVYCLIGQNPYQIDSFAKTILQTWKTRQPSGERLVFDLNGPKDWDDLEQEINHYTLFSTNRLLDARFEKKTLDKNAKCFLESYLQSPPTDCLLLLRSPNLPLKTLQAYAANNQFTLIVAQPPTNSGVKSWITEALTNQGLRFEAEVPALIQQFNEGNLLAISQILDKFQLTHRSGDLLLVETVREALHFQGEFVFFDLPQVCFENNPLKAIQILRQAMNQKQEPILILWVFSQAIRILIRMQDLIKNKQSITTAARQLKLWPSQINLYQNAAKRYERNFLNALFQKAAELDKAIKTTPINSYQELERIALALCKGSPM